MDFNISQNDYKKYLEGRNSIDNDRIRPNDQNFFDAIMSIDMENDSDGKKINEIIKAL